MGGAVVGHNRTDRPGAIFTITLPIPEVVSPLENPLA
jgi:hypothetical protein